MKEIERGESMIQERIRLLIASQKEKIAALEEELKVKRNPTVRESMEKYISLERDTLNKLYQEAKANGIDLNDLEKGQFD